MGKGPNLITGPYVSPEIDHERDMAENGASPAIARALYVVIGIGLVALFLLCGVMLHIPA